jgi:demethylmenaquinone methyltransferase/2-methoxy-6-polyprenyl-1,4-benzoquinol methylase
MTVLPYKDQQDPKKAQVRQMFNNISPKYDLLNRVLSFGIDIWWRKIAVNRLRAEKPQLILDVATGTADFALETLSLNPKHITGVDISEGMLAVGQEKINARGLQNKISLQVADSENLPFADNHFDAVTVSFGVRNFENLERGMAEMLRVLRPGGSLVVLEFSQPTAFPIKQLYGLYSRTLLPAIGRLISKDDGAYTYLPESAAVFPSGQRFLDIMSKVGYVQHRATPLLFGITSLYHGKKAA